MAGRSQEEGHLLLLHSSESMRREWLADWIRTGLEHDERVVYTEPETETDQRSVLTVARDHGVDVDAATAERRLLVLPMGDFYEPGAIARLVREARAEGYFAIRTSAESGPALGMMPFRAYAGFERVLAGLCRRLPLAALCQYEKAATTGARMDLAAGQRTAGGEVRLLAPAPAVERVLRLLRLNEAMTIDLDRRGS